MDIQQSKTCCFTGHRPQFFPWGSNAGDPAAVKMLHALKNETLQAIADGYTTFLYGVAPGVDTWAAEIVLRLRFRGSHAEAPAQYQKLLDYIDKHKMQIVGFSREITLIDYGITSDAEKFVTEICIPIKYEPDVHKSDVAI